MLILISYSSAERPHLSTGDASICCEGRTTGSRGVCRSAVELFGLCLPHDSKPGPEVGNGGFVEGVAELDAEAPFASEGGEGGTWLRM